MDMSKLSQEQLIELKKHAENFLSTNFFYLLDKNKNPINCTEKEWGNWIQENAKEKTRIARTEIFENAISTIFLTMDHNLHDSGAPLLVETMVFDKEGHGIYIDRCSTCDEAIAGHKKAIDWVQNGGGKECVTPIN